MAERLQAMRVRGYENGFGVTPMPERLSEPMRRKKPTLYFVNSMSDLFHEDIEFTYVDRIFEVIRETPRHAYQILTKRAERMADYCAGRRLPPNAWMGVSVEDRKYGVPRIELLRHVAANIRFLSIEPLLEHLGDLDLSGIHWVIVGGESGPKARPMKEQWVDAIRLQTEQQGVRFFFKQWGRWGADGKQRSKKANGRLLNDKVWNDMPAQLSIFDERQA